MKTGMFEGNARTSMACREQQCRCNYRH